MAPINALNSKVEELRRGSYGGSLEAIFLIYANIN